MRYFRAASQNSQLIFCRLTAPKKSAMNATRPTPITNMKMEKLSMNSPRLPSSYVPNFPGPGEGPRENPPRIPGRSSPVLLSRGLHSWFRQSIGYPFFPPGRLYLPTTQTTPTAMIPKTRSITIITVIISNGMDVSILVTSTDAHHVISAGARPPEQV
jgi:hypothetical protein